MTPLNNLLADYAKADDLDPAAYQLRAPDAAHAPVIPRQRAGSRGPQAGQQAQAKSNVPPPG